MRTVINPITNKGKVKCVDYYELTHTTKTKMWMCTFEYEQKVYFYRVDYNSQYIADKKTIIDIGESEPLNWEKAVGILIANIRK